MMTSELSASDENEQAVCLTSEATTTADSHDAAPRPRRASRFAPVSRIVERCAARTDNIERMYRVAA